ncbi:MAG: hypothetical protein PHS83_03735 [Clostridia bacterium]|jgi:hypothetical protein|nr:hypothetical protein [Clostridia bacterium]MDD4146203.1 hypothetical protein [Clostridia bacterium]MDD4665627.1 hypothetical protein [Clostridia bacterium]
MMAMYQALRNLMMELNELLIVYGYMIQNAPTEEARRLIELNRRTVMNTKEALVKMHKEMFGKDFTDLEEAAEEVPVFTDFRAAARYAFIEETQVIQMLKNLYLRTDSCNHNSHFNCLIEHEINAMRLLYLLT